jgi:hypothetical protein
MEGGHVQGFRKQDDVLKSRSTSSYIADTSGTMKLAICSAIAYSVA